MRNLVFAMSRILQSISHIGTKDHLPDVLRRVARGHDATWSASRALSKTDQCIAELQRQILRSTVVLQVTYNERCSAWESAVEERCRAWRASGEPSEPTILTKGVDVTSGLPLSMQSVVGMLNAIERQAASRQDPDETVEASRILVRTGRMNSIPTQPMLLNGKQNRCCAGYVYTDLLSGDTN